VAATASSVPELLTQDSLVEVVAGIEQHMHGEIMVHADLDRAYGAYLVVIGNRGDRALDRLAHLDRDMGPVGQERAAPAARPERADRVSARSGAPMGMIGPWTDRL